MISPTAPTSIWTGSGNDVILGNGGNDTILAFEGNNTLVGGAGADLVHLRRRSSISSSATRTMTPWSPARVQIRYSAAKAMTASSQAWSSPTTVSAMTACLGNEGNDRIIAGAGADTISGGADADVFIYEDPADDGSSGATVEFITDLNWAQDGFRWAWTVEFAAVTSPGGAGNLTQAAANALLAAWQQNGSADVNVAAVFAFQGRTYLVSDSNGTAQRCVPEQRRYPDRHHRRGRHGQPECPEHALTQSAEAASLHPERADRGRHSKVVPSLFAVASRASQATCAYTRGPRNGRWRLENAVIGRSPDREAALQSGWAAIRHAQCSVPRATSTAGSRYGRRPNCSAGSGGRFSR